MTEAILDRQRENWNLFRRVLTPLRRDQQTASVLDERWVSSIKELLTLLPDGTYPWQAVKSGGGAVFTFDSLETFIASEDGLSASPKQILKLLDVDAGEVPGASEAADMLRSALNHQGRRTDLNPDFGNNMPEVKAAKGTSRANTIRQIRQLSESDEPNALLAADLLNRVHRGEVSANKAAIQLGLRSRVVNFDLNKLTPEVRSEIDSLKSQEDWTTAEVLEEALRAYFRVLNADEPEDNPEVVMVKPEPEPEIDPAPAVCPAPQKTKRRGGHKAPPGQLTGVQVASITGKPNNQIGPFVARAHQKGLSAELKTPDESRTFVRHISEKFWQEVV